MIKKICGTKKIYQQGFTLVELLVVISLVGILAGVTTSIINPVKQRHVAEDGVRQSNLEKYALGIEAYANANSSYPTTIAFDVGTKKPTDVELALFVARVPDDEPTPPLPYPYSHAAATATTPEAFGVYVVEASDATKCFKYLSIWGKIKECTPLTKCQGTTDVCI